MTSDVCLVWSPISSSSGGQVELPGLIADALGADIYTHTCNDTLTRDGYKNVEFYEFRRDSTFDTIIERTPLSELSKMVEYAMWKPPEKYDSFVTRGPKALHTVQRLGQEHIHFVDGTYRGPFLHLDRYEPFHDRPAHEQFGFGMVRLFLRTAIQASIRTVDTLIVNSEWTADIVESLFDRKADAVIYPLMDVSSYSPEYQDGVAEDYYVYLGAIDPHHRVEEVITAFNHLPYRLKMAGSGSWEEEARALADDSIEFCGYVTGDEKRELLAGARALVNPTDHSFGRVLVESLASGTPIISVNEAYPPYLIDHRETGTLYEPGVENLIEAIKHLEEEGIDATTEDLVDAAKPYQREQTERKWRNIFK